MLLYVSGTGIRFWSSKIISNQPYGKVSKLLNAIKQDFLLYMELEERKSHNDHQETLKISYHTYNGVYFELFSSKVATEEFKVLRI
jgi:hypothetical protein